MLTYEPTIYRNKECYRIRSDEGRYIVHNGLLSVEACVPVELASEYTEGDLIPQEPSGTDKAEAYDILMGENL